MSITEKDVKMGVRVARFDRGMGMFDASISHRDFFAAFAMHAYIMKGVAEPAVKAYKKADQMMEARNGK